jgi:hypothetical protein
MVVATMERWRGAGVTSYDTLDNQFMSFAFHSINWQLVVSCGTEDTLQLSIPLFDLSHKQNSFIVHSTARPFS